MKKKKNKVWINVVITILILIAAVFVWRWYDTGTSPFTKAGEPVPTFPSVELGGGVSEVMECSGTCRCANSGKDKPFGPVVVNTSLSEDEFVDFLDKVCSEIACNGPGLALVGAVCT